jgi:hypothetical protein
MSEAKEAPFTVQELQVGEVWRKTRWKTTPQMTETFSKCSRKN